MLSALESLVNCESPTRDLVAVQRSAESVAAVGRSLLGVEPERVTIEGHTHLRWKLGSCPSRLLLLGHHDTVWPIGSLRSQPFAVHEGTVHGPGCFDMKAGLVIGLQAVAIVPDPSGITILVTGDEEIGSPSSRALIEAEAQGCDAVLVLEPAGDDGALKTRRKGVSLYEVSVSGREAHAGIEPERGVNATVELARQVLAIEALTSPATGTTVTPTLLSAGSSANTVPGSGSVSIDVRAWDASELARIDHALHALSPACAAARVDVHGGVNRPPLAAVHSSKLFERAAELADRLNIGPLAEAATGGGSDGNLTAGLGVPTLDGLGAVGAGAHSADEHVVVSELPRRAALAAALAAEVLGNG